MRSTLHGISPSRGASPRRTSRVAKPCAASTGPATLQRKAGHCACGGSCPRCEAGSGLRIGAPDDAYEREADAVADQVMRMAPGSGSVAAAVPVLQRKCAGREADDEEPLLSTKARSSPDSGQRSVATAPSSVHATVKSPGQPLDRAARAFFQPRFGHDFSAVRVHTDAAAARSALELNAHAYTVGHDIVFAAGRFVPQTGKGRRLLAHELTHVVQQRGGGTATVQRAAVNYVEQVEDTDPTAAQILANFDKSTTDIRLRFAEPQRNLHERPERRSGAPQGIAQDRQDRGLEDGDHSAGVRNVP
jgi:Domain of unknown function (DUF4157)